MRAIRWDIFCTVVDNFGDIGVAWRLARQLVGEHGREVRLWVDDLQTFARLCPGLDAAADAQTVRGVEICRWRRDRFGAAEPADVVIEAFGCAPPDDYVARMAARAVKPAWINLEYLSAETWVRGHHRLPSPHPRLPLTKYFYFPGFTAGTGGLLRERGLARRRAAFQQDAQALHDFWRRFGLAPAAGDEQRISLFSYENPALPGLLSAWAASATPLRCLVPEGRIVAPLAAFLGSSQLRAGGMATRGSLTVHVVPFADQDAYDLLLWACDVNFVRGEDSFVRAQWAARPLVWHIYPQQDDAHAAKLAAFLAVYAETLPATTARALRQLWHAWNALPESPAESGWDARWAAFSRERAVLETHARAWADRLAGTPDLATQLIEFVSHPH